MSDPRHRVQWMQGQLRAALAELIAANNADAVAVLAKHLPPQSVPDAWWELPAMFPASPSTCPACGGVAAAGGCEMVAPRAGTVPARGRCAAGAIWEELLTPVGCVGILVTPIYGVTESGSNVLGWARRILPPAGWPA